MLAYELLQAGPAFAEMAKHSLDNEQKEQFLLEHTTPSLIPFPEEERRILLSYLSYWHITVTGDPAVRLLLSDLLDKIRPEIQPLP